MLQVALNKAPEGLISKAIRWQTDSQYCHAGLLFDGTQLIESRAWAGVQWVKFDPSDPTWDLYDVYGIEHDQEIAIWQFGLDQLGNGYDYWGALRFVSRRRLPTNDRWFCSELVFSAFKAAGISLLNHVDPQQVSPGLLSYSPYLIKIERNI
jgi:uncharacterized protein YycO